MDAVIPSVGDHPIAFGFIGVVTAVKKIKIGSFVFLNAVFPFEFANPWIVRIHFVFDLFLEFFVSLLIGAAKEQLVVVAVFGGPIKFYKIYFHVPPHAILRIPPPKLCTVTLPNSEHQSSSLFQT